MRIANVLVHLQPSTRSTASSCSTVSGEEYSMSDSDQVVSIVITDTLSLPLLAR